MDFTVADIRTFKQLYKKHFDITLTDKLATKKLTLLVRQLEVVYQPITRMQLLALNDVNEDFNNEQPAKAN